MKKILLITFLILFNISEVFAVSLIDALSIAYKTNTELNAERENLTASKIDITISKSDYLPSASITGSKSKEETNKLTKQSGGDASITDVDPLTTSIKLEQTLMDFSRDAELEKKEINLKLAEAQLLQKEQEILFKAVEAYTGLLFANEKLIINQRNLSLLQRQVENDKVRLERGQITFSDLSQSQSSLSGAEAQFIQAKNEVITKKLNYENVIGKISDINSLNKSLKAIAEIPENLSKSMELSNLNNPSIMIAKLDLEISEKDLKIAKADLSPTASVSLERSYSDDFSATYDEREKDVLKASINWPFYSGGKKRAKVSKNQSLKVRKRLLLDNTIKTSETNVASAWSNLQSSKSFLKSVRAQVKSAKISNEGIAAEYERGSRTTLDVIQSNTFLLNAQISLSDSEKNYILAQYNLLKTIGLLSSDYLKIK